MDRRQEPGSSTRACDSLAGPGSQNKSECLNLGEPYRPSAPEGPRMAPCPQDNFRRRTGTAFRVGPGGVRALGAVVLFLLAGCGERTGVGPRAQAAPRTLAEFRGRQWGDSEAPVRILAMLPVGTGCQDVTGMWLGGIALAYPDVFSVRIFDMRSPEGRRTMAAQGIRCAAVVVNGKTRFDLPPPMGKVLLEGPMDPLDVYHVVKWVAAACGAGDLGLEEPEAESAVLKAKRAEAGFE